MIREDTKDRICRAIRSILKSANCPDDKAILLSEKIWDTAELLISIDSEESGSGELPPGVSEEEIWDHKANSPAPEPRRNVTLPPTPSRAVVKADAQATKSAIVLPDDPDFNKPVQIPGGGRKIISALSFQRKSSRVEPPKIQWDEGQLIQVILDNTPEEVEFDTINGEGQPITLTAIRNTQNQSGLNSIVLSYRHPSVSENVDGRVTVDLIAKHSFSLYDKELDIDKAMGSIMEQLRGMYRPRPKTMMPIRPEGGPLTSKGSPMGDRYDMDWESLHSSDTPDPKGAAERILRQVRSDNDNLAPKGSRF